MKKINIAILSIGRESPLIFGFKNAFKKLGVSGKIIGLDMDKNAVGLRLANIGIHVPSYSNSNFNTSLKRIIVEKRIDVIIPSSDHDLTWWSKNYKSFKQYNSKFLFSTPDTIKKTLNKKRFLTLLNNSNVPCTRIIDESQHSNDKYEFPIFINSVYGSGSTAAHRIDDQSELDYFKRKINNYIITEFINTKEISIDCYFSFDGKLISIVPRVRLYTFGGEAFITKTVWNPSIIEQTIKLLNLFQFKGAINVQAFIGDNNSIKFFEINSRFGGASHLSWEAGANAPQFIIEETLGEKPNPIIGEYDKNLLMLRYKDDIFINPAG